MVDRLAPQGLLAGLRPDVLVVDAAKVPRGPSMAQEAINAALCRTPAPAGGGPAQGGDPYVFGRGHEEVQACVAAGVPVTVVSGVSSAVAGTGTGRRAGDAPRRGARRHSRVPDTCRPGHPDWLVDWAALARLPGHRVLLMAVDTIAKIASSADRRRSRPGDSGARRAGRRAGGPAVGARPAGRDVGAVATREDIRPRAVFVLGPVVALSTTGRSDGITMGTPGMTRAGDSVPAAAGWRR